MTRYRQKDNRQRTKDKAGTLQLNGERPSMKKEKHRVRCPRLSASCWWPRFSFSRRCSSGPEQRRPSHPRHRRSRLSQQQFQPGQSPQPAAPELQPTEAQSLIPLSAAPESIVTLENDLVRIQFTSIGGAVRSVWLKKYKAEIVPQGRELLGTAVELPQGWVGTSATPMRVARPTVRSRSRQAPTA